MARVRPVAVTQLPVAVTGLFQSSTVISARLPPGYAQRVGTQKVVTDKRAGRVTDPYRLFARLSTRPHQTNRLWR